MRRPSRVRRIAKWTGVGVCVLIGAAFLASRSWGFTGNCGPFSIMIGQGGILFEIWSSEPDLDEELIHGEFIRLQGDETSIWWIETVDTQHSDGFACPCSIPFLFVAFPTGILFWRDRRFRPGHCKKCGYDLTGNTSGRCSECGKGV